MSLQFLWVHGAIAQSEVNGSGTRLVIWLQGCDQNCKGCANAGTIPGKGGTEVSVLEVVALIRAGANSGLIDGLTISGGEPLLQASALLLVLEEMARIALNRENGFPVRLYTHYTKEDIEALSPFDVRRIVSENVDELICGEYTVEGERIHKDSDEDMAEIHVLENGDLQVTGGSGAAAILKDPNFRVN